MADVKWCMSVSTSLRSDFHRALGKQAPDALEESASGDKALSVFRCSYLQVIKLHSSTVNPLQMTWAALGLHVVWEALLFPVIQPMHWNSDRTLRLMIRRQRNVESPEHKEQSDKTKCLLIILDEACWMKGLLQVVKLGYCWVFFNCRGYVDGVHIIQKTDRKDVWQWKT